MFLALFLACTSSAPPLLSPAAEAPPPAAPPLPSAAPAGDAAFEASPTLGLTYEIYVRSFQDTDGDGIGDLPGVRAHLDYLSSLGVETLWLMPLFPAAGPAGYDVTDYDRLRHEYGGESELAALVDDAHGRGMRVLLDLPLNHVSRGHPWFVAAESDPASPERDRFVYADTQWDPYRWFAADTGGWYYAFFGAELPDLDWTDGVTRARMYAVWEGWLGIVDGYRIDAATTLIEADGAITGTAATHALLAELYARAHALNPNAALLAEAYAEAPADTAAWLGRPAAPESDRVLDFPRRAALLQALEAGRPEGLLGHLYDQQDAGALGRTAPFLGSHDLSRLATVVPDGRARRLLHLLQLTLPGDPVLYYGDELDLADATSGSGQDYAQRAPMPWDRSSQSGFTTGTPWFTPDPAYADGLNAADEAADPDSVLLLIRGLACVRAELRDADWEPLATDRVSVFAYVRTTEAGRVVVVVNLSAEPAGEIAVDIRGGFRELTTDQGVYAVDGLRLHGLEGYGYAVYGDEVATRCEVPGPVR